MIWLQIFYIFQTDFSRKTGHEREERSADPPKRAGPSPPGRGSVHRVQVSDPERCSSGGSQPPRTTAQCIAENACYLATDGLGVWSHSGFANLSCQSEPRQQGDTKAQPLPAGRTLASNGAFEKLLGKPEWFFYSSTNKLNQNKLKPNPETRLDRLDFQPWPPWR